MVSVRVEFIDAEVRTDLSPAQTEDNLFYGCVGESWKKLEMERTATKNQAMNLRIRADCDVCSQMARWDAKRLYKVAPVISCAYAGLAVYHECIHDFDLDVKRTV